MRLPFLSNWLKWMSCSWTAEYTFTGTFTRPKLIDPDQMARGTGHSFHSSYGMTRTRRATCRPRIGRPGLEEAAWSPGWAVPATSAATSTVTLFLALLAVGAETATLALAAVAVTGAVVPSFRRTRDR